MIKKETNYPESNFLCAIALKNLKSIRQRTTTELILELLQVSGFARNLDLIFLSNLVRGLVYLQVSSEEVPQGELRSQVLVNSDICRKRFPHSQQVVDSDGSCFHGDNDYYNGQTWISEDDKCTTCTCEVTRRQFFSLFIIIPESFMLIFSFLLFVGL